MIPTQIEGATRVLNKPQDWDDEKNGGPCGVLPIRDVLIAELSYMVSEWTPSPEELLTLRLGGKIQLFIQGRVHPVVGMSVVS